MDFDGSYVYGIYVPMINRIFNEPDSYETINVVIPEFRLFDGFPHVTNNQMELRGVYGRLCSADLQIGASIARIISYPLKIY